MNNKHDHVRTELQKATEMFRKETCVFRNVIETVFQFNLVYRRRTDMDDRSVCVEEEDHRLLYTACGVIKSI